MNMNRELLEKPFGPSQIKQREGNFGKKLDYIEGHVVVARLNEAFEAVWSFSILKHEILDQTDEVIVLGQLRAGDVVKTQFGSSKITRAKASGEPVSLADDLKAAATDCLKKCATLLGVGLHLYNGDKVHARPANNHAGLRASYHSDRKQNGNGGRQDGNGNGNGNGRLSSKQFKYIMRLADEAGHTREDLDDEALSMFGSAVQYLSKSDASAFIKNLLSN